MGAGIATSRDVRIPPFGGEKEGAARGVQSGKVESRVNSAEVDSPTVEAREVRSTAAQPLRNSARGVLIALMVRRVEKYGNALWTHPIEREKVEGLLQ